MRRIVACAGLSAGVFGWCESADPALSLPLRPRPCAGGKANQNSTESTRGWNRPSKACDHDGLWQPAATQVSSGFLIAVFMGARFVRALETEVKRHVNISTPDITLNMGGSQLLAATIAAGPRSEYPSPAIRTRYDPGALKTTS
jgi:hypothetical protein